MALTGSNWLKRIFCKYLCVNILEKYDIVGGGFDSLHPLH